MGNSLLLLIILHLMICPAAHEFQDFKETEILSSTPILENPHHHALAPNRESKFQNFELLNATFFVTPLQATNPLQRVSQNLVSSSSTDQKAAILRC